MYSNKTTLKNNFKPFKPLSMYARSY
jgi:hypothetical protein